jgi:hypothetical protein
MGAINITIYANSLRCSWYNRINSGLWSDILMAKVEKKGERLFYKTQGHTPNAYKYSAYFKAFEALQAKFLEEEGTTARLNTPLDQLELIKGQAPRTRKEEWSKPSRTKHPFLFKNHGTMQKVVECTSRTM